MLEIRSLRQASLRLHPALSRSRNPAHSGSICGGRGGRIIRALDHGSVVLPRFFDGADAASGSGGGGRERESHLGDDDEWMRGDDERMRGGGEWVSDGGE